MKLRLLCALVCYLIWGGGGVTNSFAQKFTPKYLRENDKSLLALTSRATDDGWLEFRPDAEPVAAASFSTRFARSLGIQDGYQLKLMKDKTDPKETRHQHYQLYWKDALVEGGHLSLHSRKGTLTAAHSRVIDGLDVATDKVIAERTALTAALTDQKMAIADVQEKLLKSQLVLTSMDGNYTKESYRLAYYFDVNSEVKNSTGILIPEPMRIYVDATSGQVIKRIPLNSKCFDPSHANHNAPRTESDAPGLPPTTMNAPLQAGTFNSLHPRSNPTPTFEVDPNQSGPGYQLTATTNVQYAMRTRRDINNNGVWGDDGELTNPTLNWGNNEQNATLSHWTVYRSYQYFLNRFGINGVNGQGGIGEIFIVPVFTGGADWSAYYNRMRIGSVGGTILSAVDIVAHEYGHGMSNYFVGGWQPQAPESGSLDEGFSDIIGTTIERELYPTGGPNERWNWKLGEDAYYARNMQFPHSVIDGLGRGQPETYQEPYYWDFNNNRHHNNGVLNKWFNTLVDGTGPNNATTTPINSYEDAMSIVYWALDFYIYGDYNYPNAAQALRAAAGAVFGECSPQQKSVIEALGAVNLPVAVCNQDCNFLPSVSSIYVNCNQTVTLNAGCNGAVGNSCINTLYSFSGPNVPFNQGGNSINIIAPSSSGSYQYAVTMSKSGCYSPTRTFNVSVNCAQPSTCDFSGGPRYVGTWSNLTVQIRQISGKNVLVTAVNGSQSDKYYPRGDNFWNQVNIDPNAAGLQGCLNAGSTGFGGLGLPGGLNPPPGYAQGQENDGAVFYFLSGTTPPTNLCDFSQPRNVGTWNGMLVQIRQYPNNKKILVTAVAGASNDKHYPRGDNFWDNFTKNSDAEQYRACLNGGETGWYGLAFPGGVSPNGGY